MRLDDISLVVLRRSVDRRSDEFHTRDVSEDPEVEAAHLVHTSDGNYHGMIGKGLKAACSRLGITEVAKSHQGRGSLWRKSTAGEAPRSKPGSPSRTNAVDAYPVRTGHLRAVRALTGREFPRISELFGSRPEIGGTYFRVVDGGFQPVDLDPRSPKPLIGIGPKIGAASTVEQVETGMDARVANLLAKRRTLVPSREKQIEARVIRSALECELKLGPLGESLRFIASQWRIDLGGGGRPLDLLAVDVASRELVVIELKPDADLSAVQQVQSYVDVMRTWSAETTRFFSALATAMAAVYSCRDMPESIEVGRVRGLAAWPDRDGGFTTIPRA